MKPVSLRRLLLWLCPAVAVALATAATAHMDYAVDPAWRSSGYPSRQHGPQALDPDTLATVAVEMANRKPTIR